MQDRPSAIELLELAAHFIEREIVPITEGSRQFQARVAANVMRIVAREIQLGEPQLREEIKALAAVLGRPEPTPQSAREAHAAVLALSEELSARIRAGEADEGPWRRRAFDVARKLVEDKLKVDNPRYLEADIAARARAR